MIKFIKRLLGLEPAKQEEVKAVFVSTAAPNSAKTLEATYIPPAKPNTVNKVRAISDTTPGAVADAKAPKPANKKRRPYRGNKVKAGGAVAKPAAEVKSPAAKPAQVAKAKPAKK